MSFDDGSLGQRGDGKPAHGHPKRGLVERFASLPRVLARRLKAHVHEWPRRYVEQRARRYERDSE